MSDVMLAARGYVQSIGSVSGAMIIITGQSISTMIDRHVNEIDTKAHSILRDRCKYFTTRFQHLPTSRIEDIGLGMELKARWEESKTLVHAQIELDETKEILTQTFEAVLARGSQVGHLDEISKNLLDQSQLFGSGVSEQSTNYSSSELSATSSSLKNRFSGVE
jgi:hypothetical protein